MVKAKSWLSTKAINKPKTMIRIKKLNLNFSKNLNKKSTKKGITSWCIVPTLTERDWYKWKGQKAKIIPAKNEANLFLVK